MPMRGENVDATSLQMTFSLASARTDSRKMSADAGRQDS